MPGKPFTQYLLLLATDASEVERFRIGGETARQSMHAAGLTDPILQNTLLDGDPLHGSPAAAGQIMSNGSLVVAGAGIRTPAQVPAETTSHIVNADVVFALVADPLAEYWLRSLNSATESLAHLYAVGKPRLQSYAEMVERMVGAVVDGARVCAVAYGHPGIAAYPLHESVRQVRRAGLPVEMLAGISAADCLYADLGVDPIAIGCVNFEATDAQAFARRGAIRPRDASGRTA